MAWEMGTYQHYLKLFIKFLGYRNHMANFRCVSSLGHNQKFNYVPSDANIHDERNEEWRTYTSFRCVLSADGFF
jgi:hypothetical protein